MKVALYETFYSIKRVVSAMAKNDAVQFYYDLRESGCFKLYQIFQGIRHINLPLSSRLIL